MKTRTLVTGGAGFLGTHLCDALIANGNSVFCLDNFSTSVPSKVEHLLRHPSFELIHQDVADPLAIQVDEIYHLACPASPLQYQKEPVRTLRTAVHGTTQMLEAARASGARFLLASTSEVYGDPLQHPQTEAYWGNVNPIGPRACYDEGKRCGEAFVTAYATQYGLSTRIARIFNTYGPGMLADDGRVVSNFVSQTLRGEALTVYGNGEQTRSFCYVKDLITGLLRLMAHPCDVGPVNLGNPQETTILEIARLTQTLIGSRADILHLPLPVDDPGRRNPNIEKAKKLLGWEPEVVLADGLQATIDHFRGRLGGP